MKKKIIKLMLVLVAGSLSTCGFSQVANKSHCKQEKPFKYSDNDQRKSPFTVKKVENKTKQSFSANSIAHPLKFVGLLKNTTNTWVLLRQQQGGIVHVTLGDDLGMEYGKIVKIEQNSFSLEKMSKIRGKWHKRIIQYRLNEPQ